MLSVIIPTLNEEKCLSLLLADLAGQIYRDFEVIVSDGSSADSTVKIARKFKSKLPALTIVSSSKRHVCTQRNLGAKTARGDILVFCDADSRIGPEFLLGLRYHWELSRAQVLSFWFKPDISTPQNEAVALAINLFRELQNNLKPSYLLEALVAIDRKSFISAGGFDDSVHFAEGSQLIRLLVKQGCVSKIVRDPVWKQSFRRFRQLGLLSIAGKVASLELSKLAGKKYHKKLAQKIYPMGGQQFEFDNKTRNRFIDKIGRLLFDKIS